MPIASLVKPIARVVRTLHAIGALRTTAAELEHVITAASQAGRPTVDHSDLARALCVMAAGDNMHVGDWMERTVYELQMPRRKAPARRWRAWARRSSSWSARWRKPSPQIRRDARLER
jgi:hypothetical protein